MILDKDLVKQTWMRCTGRCECKRIGCQHPGGRCGNKVEEKMLADDDPGGWYVRAINEFGPQKLFNVEVVCAECFNKHKPGVTMSTDSISKGTQEAVNR